MSVEELKRATSLRIAEKVVYVCLNAVITNRTFQPEQSATLYNTINTNSIYNEIQPTPNIYSESVRES